jgi:hypothetical protein
MLSLFCLAIFTGLFSGVATGSYNDAPYVYIPIEFLYGADSRVTTNITFGNSNPITVVMDTGSASAWIWQYGALVHWGSPYLFDPGPCNLTVPSDLTYNPLSSLTSRSCSVAPSYDKGIIGLSPYIVTNISQGPSFRDNLLSSSLVLSKIMVTWFDSPPESLSTLSGGLLLGAIDTSKFAGPLVRVPVVTATGQVGYYLPKPTVSFNNQTFVPDENTTCLLDSGTHADYLPFNYSGIVGSQFFNGSGGILVYENDVVGWNGSCESIPRDLNISYAFEGYNDGKSVRIDVPLRNYARGAALQGNASVCLLNLEVGGCTFGAPFYSGAAIAVDDDAGVLAMAQGGVSRGGGGVDSLALKIFGAGETFDFV